MIRAERKKKSFPVSSSCMDSGVPSNPKSLATLKALKPLSLHKWKGDLQ